MAEAIVLLHGWPGTRHDFRRVLPLLGGGVPVLAPDLLGYGDAFAGPLEEADATVAAHAARVVELLDAEGRGTAVLAGYDIGSRVAQEVAAAAPERVAGLVVTPYFPALLEHVGDPAHQPQLWYQHLHRLPLAEALIDGRPEAVAADLEHFWRAWSGDPGLAAPDELAPVVEAYGRPGAFAASIAWYRANRGYAAGGAPAPLDTPTTVLWGDRDPLFPSAWAEPALVARSFADATLQVLEGVGHFVPLEAPEAFAAAVLARTLAG